MKLQGLPEATKFKLLSEVVSESLTLKGMGLEADRVKKLLVVQSEMMVQLSVPSWEEAERICPVHAKESALQPFIGCNFKQGTPRLFMAFVRDAVEWRAKLETTADANGQPPQSLRNGECCAVFLPALDESVLQQVEGFTGAVALVADMEESTSGLDMLEDIETVAKT
ncbi:uncharacterized protein [Asterias amurensis]|uniref:uncharacterized protein n=1 Tax=Asterias amurensis TaxID=7602 RepID=UPI003AB5FC22